MSVLKTEISSIDIRSAIDGVVRRWWLVGLGVVVSIGIVGLQDFGLISKSTPILTVVERRYEPMNEIDELGLARIEPSMIVPTPSFENQLAILTSPEVLEQLQAKSDSMASMEITRSEPRFTIVESIDNANNRVSFLSTGTPNIIFKCIGSDRSECIRLTDAYVAMTVELRKESILGGLSEASSLIQGLIESVSQDRSNLGDNAYRAAARESELAVLETKRIAINQAISKISGGLIPVTDDTYQLGGEKSPVSMSSYGFAATVGLILGLLVALQVSYSDSTIRFAWQILRIDREIQVIGSPFPRADAVQATAVASAIERTAYGGTTSVLVIAHSKKAQSFAADALALAPSVRGEVLTSIDSLSVQHLINPGDRGLVIVVEKEKMKRRDLSEITGVARSGGLSLIGVVLIA
jgi:hypothetical protein